ncbi:Beta-arrestin-2 [Melipona quadrifasciata]|uniref:Beta-arrestin-2 n=1 Tax=Melipona quadrifasciata TaxID=166423 RepID=A0A0M8ZQ57_9HYME|nr:Beta-arrestin-2 [Melipona quadrifasciata]
MFDLTTFTLEEEKDKKKAQLFEERIFHRLSKKLENPSDNVSEAVSSQRHFLLHNFYLHKDLYQHQTQLSLTQRELKVYKKSSPNNKLTLYLASRDLTVSEAKIDKLQGVLLVDPDFLQDKRGRIDRLPSKVYRNEVPRTGCELYESSKVNLKIIEIIAIYSKLVSNYRMLDYRCKTHKKLKTVGLSRGVIALQFKKDSKKMRFHKVANCEETRPQILQSTRPTFQSQMWPNPVLVRLCHVSFEIEIRKFPPLVKVKLTCCQNELMYEIHFAGLYSTIEIEQRSKNKRLE